MGQHDGEFGLHLLVGLLVKLIYFGFNLLGGAIGHYPSQRIGYKFLIIIFSSNTILGVFNPGLHFTFKKYNYNGNLVSIP
jgi:hypothetical protein